MIALPKSILVAGGIVAIAGTVIFLADRNGYNRATAKVAEITAQAVSEAKQEQAQIQKALTDVVDQYYLAIENNQAHSAGLQTTINQLRGQGHGPCTENSTDHTVLPAIYRVFNTAADHPDLPAAIGARIPDAAGDGFDAISYATTDRHRLAIQVTALQAIIRESACFTVNQ